MLERYNFPLAHTEFDFRLSSGITFPMDEMWKAIPEMQLYEASSLGRIRYAKTRRIRKLTDYKGYRTVKLKNDKREEKNFFVHRLVALAFIGPPTADTINHKNFDRSDNRPENIEYVSREDNIAHARSQGRYPKVTNPTGYNGTECRKGINHSRAKLKEEDVLAIRNSGEHPKILAPRYGVTESHVRDIVKRKVWSHLK